jgi:hypothetical protein
MLVAPLDTQLHSVIDKALGAVGLDAVLVHSVTLSGIAQFRPLTSGARVRLPLGSPGLPFAFESRRARSDRNFRFSQIGFRDFARSERTGAVPHRRVGSKKND